jgi:hypothetical protein
MTKKQTRSPISTQKIRSPLKLADGNPLGEGFGEDDGLAAAWANTGD